MKRVIERKCYLFKALAYNARLSESPSLLLWREKVAEGRMDHPSGGARTMKSGRRYSAVPLTLTLSPQGRGDRAGFTLLEMIVAMLLLGTAMAVVVPTLAWMGVENRLSLQRQEACQELGNLMDELTARPYTELTPEAAGKIDLSEALKRQLPSAKLTAEITEAEPNAKRIQLRLSWNQQNGLPLAPVRLTAWVHQREERP